MLDLSKKNGWRSIYRPVQYGTFFASHGGQLEHDGDQGAIEKVRLLECNFEDTEATKGSSNTDILIKSSIEQIPQIVTQCSLHISSNDAHVNCALTPPLSSNFALS